MASKTTSRSIQSLSRQARQKCSCAAPQSSRSNTARQFSISASRSDTQYDGEQGARPRWSYTPPQMKLPFNPRANHDIPTWQVNSDPEQLNRFYTQFLGRGGDRVLTDEVKWLAVTHKSFDQGRRGFNDRLAYFGRRILSLQTSLVLLQSPIARRAQLPQDTEDVEPYSHPALDGLTNLTNVKVDDILSKERLASLGTRMGMPDIIRWEPRMKDNLEKSGIDLVMATSLYAIIGAVALQKGGDFATNVARERVLKPLAIS
ncbi:db5b554f-75ce-4d01-aad4-a885326df315 [Sclerotinia trifoliorum]|uniref:Db5b554f-75ce-4d01-aad4-a885326df315 n=1 Tax=Sclerotinia trifoliorum TaxID=28548 RepID=A0A8H2VSD9_9HELO|nr:db5b554f-75ce-4d01-aad4-a885326df315 [Sclerotinia trifoliorum]